MKGRIEELISQSTNTEKCKKKECSCGFLREPLIKT